MNADHITALSTVVLAIITGYYAHSTHRMLQEMKRQAKIQAITVEITVLNNGQTSRSGSASTERVKKLIEELHLLSGET